MSFLLWHFSPGDKIENRPAQFLAVCWIAHVEFKVHRLRDGFSVSNALLLGQSLPTIRIADAHRDNGKRFVVRAATERQSKRCAGAIPFYRTKVL
jgi:hypothetical protein